MIAQHSRVLAVGDTRSGKSELLAHLANLARCQRILIDTKAEWRCGVRPVSLHATTSEQAAGEAAAIDWTAPIVHVIPDPGERVQLEALYAAIDRIPRPVLVWTDELHDVSNGNWEPRGLRRLYKTGAARRHGALGACQRPLDVSMSAKTQASHLFISRDVGADDLDHLLRWVPFTASCDPPVPQLVAELPAYGFVWIDKPARAVTVVDPLPEHLRGGGPFRKRPGFDTA